MQRTIRKITSAMQSALRAFGKLLRLTLRVTDARPCPPLPTGAAGATSSALVLGTPLVVAPTPRLHPGPRSTVPAPQPTVDGGAPCDALGRPPLAPRPMYRAGSAPSALRGGTGACSRPTTTQRWGSGTWARTPVPSPIADPDRLYDGGDFKWEYVPPSPARLRAGRSRAAHVISFLRAAGTVCTQRASPTVFACGSDEGVPCVLSDELSGFMPQASW
jgi:hypothetical protein